MSKSWFLVIWEARGLLKNYITAVSPCLFTDNNSYILAYCRQWFSPWTLPGTPAFLYKVKFTAEITAGNFGRQCHFFANLHFDIYVFQFVQYLLSRNVENKSAKNKQFAVDFLDFGMSESWFLVILEARWLFLESRRSIVRISGIVLISGALRSRKSSPILRQIWTSF